MEIRYIKNPKYILLALLGTISTSLSYLIYIYDPLALIIPKVTAFHPGSIAYSMWQDPPYEIMIRVYIYNVTNPEEFLAGEEKLTFKEVGPYTYREVLYNINTTFNDNGTISFVPQRRLHFVPEQSIGDPAIDTLLLPNIPLLGITASLVEESMFLNLGVASVSSYLGSKAFVNVTINEYLYGYDDPLVTLANNFVPNWIDFPRFGILDRLMALDNGSSIVTMNIDPSLSMSNNELLTKKERLQSFSIQKWNGSPGLHQWGYKEPIENETIPGNSKCNLVEGSFMGTIFPHDIEKNTTFRLYRHAFCRPIPVIYENSGYSKDGFEAYMYRVKDDFLARPEENPENDCYCTEGKCLPKGLTDLAPCYYNIPIVLSQPHFFNADPKLLEQIGGLSPDKDKHDTFLTIHPRIGVPLEAKLRVQVNLAIPNTRYNEKTKPFNNLVLPLFWAEVSVDDVPSKLKLIIRLLYHILPITQLVVMYTLGFVGIILVFGSALASVLLTQNGSKTGRGVKVNYSEIPVFPLKTHLLKPSILVQK